MIRCEAHNRRGERCGLPVVVGKRVCRQHGGLTPKGRDSPHWKTGRYSRALPARLAARFEAGINDEQLLHLTDEIGALDARAAELIEQLNDIAPGSAGERAVWEEIIGVFDQRRRLVLAEVRRMVTLEQFVPVTEALAYAEAVTACVRKHVHDPKTLQAIGRDIERLAYREGDDTTMQGRA